MHSKVDGNALPLLPILLNKCSEVQISVVEWCREWHETKYLRVFLFLPQSTGNGTRRVELCLLH
jgi:hypothetical protein